MGCDGLVAKGRKCKCDGQCKMDKSMALLVNLDASKDLRPAILDHAF